MTDNTLPSSDHETNLIPGAVKAIKAANQRSDNMYFLDVNDIVVIEGYNVRVETQSYLDHLQGIVDSMVAEGFHIDSPLSVYVAKIDGEDKPVLVRGHTRLKAVRLAIASGAVIEKVPVVFKAKSTSPTDLDLDLITSNSGRNLTSYETAVVIKRLMTQGLEVPEVAKKTGISVPYIETLVVLASAPPRLAKMVAHDEVSTSLAVDLIRKHGPVAAQRLAMDAWERAKKAGHKQATVRNTPEASLKKVVKKKASELFDVTSTIFNDPGYAGLSEETRSKLDKLLQDINEAKAAADGSGREGEGDLEKDQLGE